MRGGESRWRVSLVRRGGCDFCGDALVVEVECKMYSGNAVNFLPG